MGNASFLHHIRRLLGFNPKRANQVRKARKEYSPGFKEVVVLSRTEAFRRRDTHADVHHLLLGILQRGEGGAIDLLKSLGVNLEALSDFLNVHYPKKVVVVKVGPRETLLTHETEKILKVALLEAGIHKSEIVGTEHLLISIFRNEHLEVVQLLDDAFNIKYEKLRDAVNPIPS